MKKFVYQIIILIFFFKIPIFYEKNRLEAIFRPVIFT